MWEKQEHEIVSFSRIGAEITCPGVREVAAGDPLDTPALHKTRADSRGARSHAREGLAGKKMSGKK